MSDENVAPNQPPQKDEAPEDQIVQKLKTLAFEELKKLLKTNQEILEKGTIKLPEEKRNKIRNFIKSVEDEIKMREDADNLEKMVNNLCLDPYIQLATEYWTEKEKIVRETQKNKFKPSSSLKMHTASKKSNKEGHKHEKQIKVLDLKESLAILESTKQKEEKLRSFNHGYLAVLRQKKAVERVDMELHDSDSYDERDQLDPDDSDSD